MIRVGPIVALARSSPTRDEITFLIELENRRSRRAALSNLRLRRRMQLTSFERSRAMNNPDVILRINRHADGLTLQPMIRQRFRPQRIDFETRGLYGCGFYCSPLLQDASRNQQHGKQYQEYGGNVEI